jgi:hypothetical protein
MGHCGARLSVLYMAWQCVRDKAVCLERWWFEGLELCIQGVMHQQQCSSTRTSEGMHSKGEGHEGCSTAAVCVRRGKADSGRRTVCGAGARGFGGGGGVCR